MSETIFDTLEEQLKNPEFAKEWKLLQPELAIMRAVIDGREKKSLTQKDLSKLTHITQSDISKLENGNSNPSIKTLQRVAGALDKTLFLVFLDNQ